MAKAPKKKNGNGNAKDGKDDMEKIGKGGGVTTAEDMAIFEKPWVQSILYAIVVTIFGFAIYKGVIGDSSIVEGLSESKTARGLITFIFAIGTMGIALLVCLRGLVGSGEPAKESFYRAKEVLTILVGILGTIVGFYFGSAPEERPAELTVAAPILSAHEVQSQDEVLFTTFVSGGKSPYRYTITFPQLNDLVIEGLADRSGWIRKKFSAPVVATDMRLVYRLEIEDAGGTKGAFKCEKSDGLRIIPLAELGPVKPSH